MMKATFMSLWDGLASDNNAKIMVMGATNRPQHIDQAILRRMPIRLNVPMPVRMISCLLVYNYSKAKAVCI